MSWTVESVMTRAVIAIRPTTGYKEIASLMREHEMSALPVVDVTDSDGRVVGIVSEADLLLKETRPSGRRPLGGARGLAKATATTAADLMTAPVVSIGPGASLTEAARTMHRAGVKRLPVIDPGGRLVGIVSRADLVKAYLRSDESIRHEVAEEVVRHTLAIDPESLVIAVADGVVSFEGTLETRSLGTILVRLTRAVEGVVAVDDRALGYRLDDTGLTAELPPLALKLSAPERRL